METESAPGRHASAVDSGSNRLTVIGTIQIRLVSEPVEAATLLRKCGEFGGIRRFGGTERNGLSSADEVVHVILDEPRHRRPTAGSIVTERVQSLGAELYVQLGHWYLSIPLGTRNPIDGSAGSWRSWAARRPRLTGPPHLRTTAAS